MIRVILIVSLCVFLAACQSAKSGAVPLLQDFTRLASMKSIYLEDLGKEDGGDLIEGSGIVREKIRKGLAQSGRFSIVESPQQADAILAGLAGFEKWYHGMEGFYGLEGDLDTHFLGVGHFRLLDSRTKETIWTHEYKTGFLNPKQSVAERVGEQVVDKLIHDTALADGSR